MGRTGGNLVPRPSQLGNGSRACRAAVVIVLSDQQRAVAQDPLPRQSLPCVPSMRVTKQCLLCHRCSSSSSQHQRLGTLTAKSIPVVCGRSSFSRSCWRYRHY